MLPYHLRFRLTVAFIAGLSTFWTLPLAAEPLDKEALGKSLFFDVNLSKNRTQACATCHDPDRGFADPRRNITRGAVSLGDDGRSLGDRNAPTASYAAQIPEFSRNLGRGGLFHDGRAATLTDQAKGPPLNPLEMGMPDKAAIVARLKENPAYVETFRALYGADILDDADKAYDAMADSIAAFERTAFFQPFDSKYDRHLRGEYTLTEAERRGMALFFDEKATNCAKCHQLKEKPQSAGETFSSYEYHNIGIPVNRAVRAVNGTPPDHIDRGLLENPGVRGAEQRGKFKTPTLRNVAVTAPYMHNGVFQDLETTVVFYNKYLSKAKEAQTNPETGEPWDPPEVRDTLSLKELEAGEALSAERIEALVAFLKALTDQRYEHLLE